jgi:outer membrane protein, multidrug efflux system
MVARPFAALVAICLLAGCAPTVEPHGVLGKLWHLEVGPDYRRPDVTLPAEFRSQMQAAEAASLADLPWWKVFGDVRLQRLIGEALADNYDLQAAAARVEESRASVSVAASQLYPQVGYLGAASRQKVLLPIGDLPNTTLNVFTGLFNVAWEVDLWGRIRRSTEAARAIYFGSEAARRGIMLTLVSDVAAAYFQLLELDRERAIAHDSSDTYGQTLQLFTQRYQHGTDTKLSTSRAQAALQSSTAAIARLDRQIIQQENALSVLLGKNPEAIERGVSLAKQTMPQTPPGLTTALLQRRPDIRQAEEVMIAANAEVGVAVADFFPTIGLSALYGGSSKKIGDIVTRSFSVWNIAASAAGPVFRGGELLETYYAQKAFWDQAIARYKATIVQAFREVSDALAAESTLARQRAALEKQVAALQEAVHLSLLRYNTGLSTYFEVLEAEQQLYPAEDALAQTQRDQLLAVVDLYKALGGGWELTDTQFNKAS